MEAFAPGSTGNQRPEKKDFKTWKTQKENFKTWKIQKRKKEEKFNWKQEQSTPITIWND